MNAVQIAKELKVIVDKNENKIDEYLSRLLNHTISQLEYFSKFDSLLLRTYENKKIIPVLNKIKTKINSNENKINLEKHFNDFINLYSLCEILHSAFVVKTPLFKDLEERFNESFNKKIEEYDEAFNKRDTEFAKKLTSIQTALGQAQTNAGAIETIHKNATTSGQTITTMESEYNTAKTNYTDQKEKYDELILSIKSKEKEIEDLKIEIDEIKNEKSTELDNLQKELETEKEKIKDILGLANMASMAKSFLDRKKELDNPINDSANWRNWGLVGMAVMLFAVLIYEWYIGFDYIRFLTRLPMITPLVWLVWVNSQRNAHLVRIQEEYAHKASVALAFEGYQRKVEELDDPNIKKLLLELSVYNLGENPVNLFDKNVKSSPVEGSIFSKIIEKWFAKTDKE